MNQPYRSTSRSARIIAAAAALFTVWFLFDFVALLGDAGHSPATDARAAQATVRAA